MKLSSSRGFAMADNILVFYGSYRADRVGHPHGELRHPGASTPAATWRS